MRSYFGYHFVDDAYVGKGASGHDEIVASSRSVSVEIFLFDTFLLEKTGGRRGDGDVSSWRDVICRDGVSEDCQNIGVSDRFYFRKFFLSVFEERGIVYIG